MTDRFQTILAADTAIPSRRKPRALDLYCKAGGAGTGLHLAGFEVVGVDIEPQPHYPFEFHQADALDYPLGGFDFIHASPPCQRYSRATMRWKSNKKHPDLLAATRTRILPAGVPYSIENVDGAPLARGSVMLCGTMFGLGVFRHRWFETSHLLLSPAHRKHDGTTGSHRLNVKGSGYHHVGHKYVCVVGHSFELKRGREAMGIDWMNRDELSQAIPPAYSRWIGEQMMPVVMRAKVGAA